MSAFVFNGNERIELDGIDLSFDLRPIDITSWGDSHRTYHTSKEPTMPTTENIDARRRRLYAELERLDAEEERAAKHAPALELIAGAKDGTVIRYRRRYMLARGRSYNFAAIKFGRTWYTTRSSGDAITTAEFEQLILDGHITKLRVATAWAKP